MITIKKILFLQIFLILNLAYSQDLESLMKNGNDFYQAKQFQEAIESYESILRQGYLSSQLYYNLGNAHFRLGEIGKAILYYEKSLKISPGNDDAAHNLKIANARTVDKIREIPPIFIVKWWNILLSTFTSTEWQIIIIIFYLLLLTSIGIYFLSRNLQFQKSAFIFGSLNIVAIILSVILFLSSLARESSDEYGVLLTSVVSAKISPDEGSNDAFVIHEGIKFKIEDELNNWIKIKLSDGKVGWLPANTFEII